MVFLKDTCVVDTLSRGINVSSLVTTTPGAQGVRDGLDAGRPGVSVCCHWIGYCARHPWKFFYQ